MTAIITGDIVNSRTVAPEEWLGNLEKSLNSLATDKKHWEVFRGDSFQLEVSVDQALKAVLYLKSSIKQIKGLDVRMSIGIGEKTYENTQLTQSNGSAFIHSGEAFERLKDRTLIFQSNNASWDETLNLILDLLSTIVDQWTPVSVSLIHKMFQNPNLTQRELGQMTSRSQSNISNALKRGGYDEVLKVLHYYSKNNPL